MRQRASSRPKGAQARLQRLQGGLRAPAAFRPTAELTSFHALELSVADARKIVAIWNARQAGGRALWFHPTIGAAIVQLESLG
jgi:hypothetical protein